MNRLILSLSMAIIIGLTACGGSNQTTPNSAGNGPTRTDAGENKTTLSVVAGSPSSLVKDVYDNAMKKNCKSIPPMLTEEFRKSVGTTETELEALCDTFTDSSKLARFEVKGETINGDSAKVKVALTYKDGKKEEKEENVKKQGDKWLLDS